MVTPPPEPNPTAADTFTIPVGTITDAVTVPLTTFATVTTPSSKLRSTTHTPMTTQKQYQISSSTIISSRSTTSLIGSLSTLPLFLSTTTTLLQSTTTHATSISLKLDQPFPAYVIGIIIASIVLIVVITIFVVKRQNHAKGDENVVLNSSSNQYGSVPIRNNYANPNGVAIPGDNAHYAEFINAKQLDKIAPSNYANPNEVVQPPDNAHYEEFIGAKELDQLAPSNK